jgi:hypothetical protein
MRTIVNFVGEGLQPLPHFGPVFVGAPLAAPSRPAQVKATKKILNSPGARI